MGAGRAISRQAWAAHIGALFLKSESPQASIHPQPRPREIPEPGAFWFKKTTLNSPFQKNTSVSLAPGWAMGQAASAAQRPHSNLPVFLAFSILSL